MTVITISTLQNMIYNRCSNRRVAYLMKHGKTARVRKKNFKRAFLIYLRDLQNGTEVQ